MNLVCDEISALHLSLLLSPTRALCSGARPQEGPIEHPAAEDDDDDESAVDVER